MSAVMKDDQESSEREDAQRMLADAVNTFVTRATTVKRVRELRDTQPGFDRNLWQSIADQGWLGIHVPEQYGGQGLGFSELRIVAQDPAGKDVGWVVQGDHTDPATGLLRVRPLQLSSFCLRLDEAFAGPFTVSIVDPVTQQSYAKLELETQFHR